MPVLKISVSIVKVRFAGVGSTLPPPSIPLTSNVCSPSLSGSVVTGESQAANGSSSTRHSCDNAPSVYSKAKLGVRS
jgi:hypothetical protein